ncbi:synembryn-A isoform X3 [Oreochromis niloticus]|uniref:synembryn-A isoform X3 n=1 Tax=Oreochromis niloticus TaxID=8128 RepID=UPI0009051A48|nr:synembryn-A isoform X3 [Oreochromis niloticus]
MVPDIERIIESIVRRDQDSVQLLLNSYNTQYAECFFFNTEEQERRKQQQLEEFRKKKFRDCAPASDSDIDSDDENAELLLRQDLSAALLCFIGSQLQPAVLRVSLHTLRILSRDRRALGHMVTDSALLTLAHMGGIAIPQTCLQQENKEAEDQVGRSCSTTHIRAVSSCEQGAEAGTAPSGCSVVSFSVLAEGAVSPATCGSVNHCYQQKHDGEHVTLSRGKKDTQQDNIEELEKEEDGEVCRKEALKVLCNVIYNSPRAQERASALRLLQGLWESLKEEIWSKVPLSCHFYKLRLLFLLTALRPELRLQLQQEDAALYRHLVAVLRHCLLLSCEGEDTLEELQGHTVNVLSALPLTCLDVLVSVQVDQASHKCEGVNMDCVHNLLLFMNRRLNRGQKLKEKLTPVLNLLTESSRVHRETRHYLRQKILPPLRDVAIRPEQDSSLRGQLVRLMTHVDTDVKDCAAELLFVLCKENVSRFVKYTGYGNAAGLLAARGLLNGRMSSSNSQYSSDSDSDTEEYREAKAKINLVTGRVEADQPDPMEGMTDEEKEEEARHLISMINRLSRDQIIQPMGVTAEGRLAPLWGQMSDCTLEEEEEEELNLIPEGGKDSQME